MVSHDTDLALKKKISSCSDAAMKIRLRAVRLALSGKRRYEIAAQLGADTSCITTWLQKYNESGTDALKSNKGGRPEGNPKWDADIFIALAKEIDTGGYWSIPRMQEWIIDRYKKDIPEQTVWFRMDQLNYSYKSARPSPIGGDETKRSAFKKGASRHSWSH
jgi:transposase